MEHRDGRGEGGGGRGADGGGHQPRDGRSPAQGRRDGGPEGTEFLQLEISQVLYGDARSAAREAARDLLREAIRERLRQRVGDRLRAIGVLVADELADELETNVAIEQRIDAQRRRKEEIEEKLRAIFEPPPEPAKPPSDVG